MRFILYIVALLSTSTLLAHSMSDSTLMNIGTQQPRSEVVVYERENTSENQKASSSRYLAVVDGWEHTDNNNYIFSSKFTRPFSWIGRELFLRVRSASMPYTLHINGVEVGRVTSSGSMWEFNITKATKEGRNNITITLDKSSEVEPIEGWERASEPAIGNVCVLSQPTAMIRDISVTTTLVGDELQSVFNLALKSHALNPRTSTIHYSLHDTNGKLVSFSRQDITLSMRGEDTLSFLAKIPKSEGWSAENPKLYTLSLKTVHEGRTLELHNYKVGLRAISVDPQSGAMLINGDPVTLNAKCVGATFTPSDIDQLKADGYNTIRLAAAAAPSDIYSAANQMGLYIIAPMAINSSKSATHRDKGGNPSNDPRWWGAYKQRVDNGYYTTRLHPSVVAFSLADSSLNGCNLYDGYLHLKSKGDPRPVVYFESEGEWNSDKLQINLATPQK